MNTLLATRLTPNCTPADVRGAPLQSMYLTLRPKHLCTYVIIREYHRSLSNHYKVTEIYSGDLRLFFYSKYDLPSKIFQTDIMLLAES
jgi:hypothetical protein